MYTHARPRWQSKNGYEWGIYNSGGGVGWGGVRGELRQEAIRAGKERLWDETVEECKGVDRRVGGEGCLCEVG